MRTRPLFSIRRRKKRWEFFTVETRLCRRYGTDRTKLLLTQVVKASVSLLLLLVLNLQDGEYRQSLGLQYCSDVFFGVTMFLEKWSSLKSTDSEDRQ